jgi:hypothetical protein
MRKLLLICVIAAATTMAKAQSTMVVQSSNDDSKRSGVALNDIEKVTFEGNNVVVKTSNGADKKFDMNAFNKVTFDNSPVGIAGTKAEKDGLQFVYDGENISVSGLKAATAVVVYNAAGAVVASKKAWNGNKLSVSGLPEGMYLLSVKGVPYKFLRK